MDSKCKKNPKVTKLPSRWKKLRRKGRKKRRLERQKFKNFNYRRQRNITSGHIFTNNSQFSASTATIMNNYTGSEWFFENYRFGQAWARKHDYAVTMATHAGLEYENNMLRTRVLQLMQENQELRQATTSDPQTYHETRQTEHLVDTRQYRDPGKSYVDSELDTEENEEVDDDVDDEEDEIDEEFKRFLEITMRHQLERKKFKEQAKERDESGNNFVADYSSQVPTCSKPMNTEEKHKIMKRLYGDDWAMILGMETALQLTFERNRDRQRPIIWPNIPLRNPQERVVFVSD